MYPLRFLLFFLFSLNLPIQAQQAIGEWNSYLPYNSLNAVTTDGEHIIAAAANSNYYAYQPDSEVIQISAVAEKLSDTNPALIRYNEVTESLLLVYENSIIDLVEGDQVTVIDGVFVNNFYSNKKINNVHFVGDKAYLSCGFGVVIFDLTSKLFLDDFPIGPEGTTIQVNDLTDNGERLFAATENGLMSIELDNSFPDNFNNWTRYEEDDPNLDRAFENVAFSGGQVFGSSQNELYVLSDDSWDLIYNATDTAVPSGFEIINISEGNDRLILCEYQDDGSGGISDTRVTFFESDFSYNYVNETFIGRPREAVEDSQGVVWVADNWFGLAKIVNNTIEQRILPSGPSDHNAKNLDVANGILYVAPGKLDWAVNPDDEDPNGSGFFVLENGVWKNYSINQYAAIQGALDIANVKAHPSNGSAYFGSFRKGLIEFSNETPELITEGSTLQSSTDESRIRVTGMDFDREGNLWISNHNAEEPLSVLTPEGEWESFDLLGEARVFKVMVDRFGQKWCLISRGGIVVYDEGDDLFNSSDDQYARFTDNPDFGNLQTERVYCIAEDNEGEIWLGTEDGLTIFFCSSRVFDGNCNASRPTAEVDGTLKFLLEGQAIRSLAIDGGNRKWVGTDNGLRLLSADGKQSLEYFTTENSPLLSDAILSLAYDEESGVLYIGTEKGINSYQTDSRGGSAVHENVIVYPNPIRPEYDGIIAIDGLVENAEVKITDISGHLIYETFANGSQATWDGKNYNGDRAATGVYLVFSSNEDGLETYVTKLFFVN